MESYDYVLEEQIEKIESLERELKNKEYEFQKIKSELDEEKNELQYARELLSQSESALSDANETVRMLRLSLFTLCIFISVLLAGTCFYNSTRSAIQEFISAPDWRTILNVTISVVMLPVFVIVFYFSAILFSVIVPGFLEENYLEQHHLLNCRFYTKYRNDIFCVITSGVFAGFIAYLIMR